MIARITNFASKENKIIDWDERIPKIRYEWRDFNISIYNTLIEQFYLLLEKYPDCLKDEVIMKKYQQLKKYAKEHKIAINNLYSYSNRVELDDVLRGNPKNNIYGIRIIPIDYGYTDGYITITNYNTTTSGILLDKNELKLKLCKDNINYVSMTEVDPFVTLILVSEKKFVKHL